MKVILQLLLAGIVASSTSVASPVTRIKEAVANYPIATVGSACLAGCFALYAHAVRHQVLHKRAVEKLVEKHQGKIYSKKELEKNITQAIGNDAVIPSAIIKRIDRTPYTNDERKELKLYARIYNIEIERRNSGAQLEDLDELCFNGIKTNIRAFFERTSYHEIRYQKAQARERWSLYLATATLMGMAVAYAHNHKATRPYYGLAPLINV